MRRLRRGGGRARTCRRRPRPPSPAPSTLASTSPTCVLAVLCCAVLCRQGGRGVIDRERMRSACALHLAFVAAGPHCPHCLHCCGSPAWSPYLQIQEAVEALDPNRLCTEYWAGKEDRLAAAAGVLPAAGGAPRAQRAQRQPAGGTRRTGGGGGGSRKGRRREEDSDSEGGEAEGEGEEDETQYMATK